jgi:single-strand DNA-binding protein
MNKVVLMGNVGSDPDLKQVGDGHKLTFSLATNERWKDKTSGQIQQKTEWHRVELWGPRAQGIAPHLSKGMYLGIEGKIETEKWEDKNQVTRYTTKIKAKDIHFTGGGGNGGGGQQRQAAPQQQQQQHAAPPQQAQQTMDAPGLDDIPF